MVAIVRKTRPAIKLRPSPATADSVESSSESVNKATVNPKKNGQSAEKPRSLALPNELKDFASYNYIFTLYCLSQAEVNDPEGTYRKEPPKLGILKSGGGLGNKKVTLAVETDKRFEFFIDNVEIEHQIAPNIRNKQSNQHKVSFDVLEPFSMGTFLQVLQIAAGNAGYKNYRQAPFLLTLDFIGWDINGKIVNKPTLRRLFPLKFNKLDMKVTESGSTYSAECNPWAEQNFNSVIMDSKADLKLEGQSLLELCQKGIYSIATHFNNREAQKKANGDVLTPDQYVIMFPKENGPERFSAKTVFSGGSSDSGATVNVDELWESGRGTNVGSVDPRFAGEVDKVKGLKNVVGNPGIAAKSYAENEAKVNEIGTAKIVDDFTSGKKQPFGKPRFTESEDEPGLFERGRIQLRKNGTVITFKSGTSIIDMLEELILLSDYGKKIADATPDENGMIPYFKIETHCYVVDDPAQESKGGRHPNVYVFAVLPFRAHVSKYGPISEAYPGYDNLVSQACKEYDYLYTGKNDDIIDFDLTFDSAFYVSYQGSGGNKTLANRNKKSDQMYKQDQEVQISTETGTGESSTAGNLTLEENMSTTTGGVGGSLGTYDKISIARAINDAFLNNEKDLARVNLSIWGDPYYIADSGFGNYSADANPVSINLTKDGTMDYQREEVDVLVTFRTPIDYKETGWQDFTGAGVVPAFSGLYAVQTAISRFKDGLFTQVLSMNRRKNQNYDIKPIAATSKAAEPKPKSAGAEAKTAMAEKPTAGKTQTGIAQDVIDAGP